MGAPLVLIGAGGFARELLDALEHINLDAAPTERHEVVAVLADPEPDPWSFEPYGLGPDLLGPLAALSTIPAGTAYVVAIGAPGTRARIDEEVHDRPSPVLVHPGATVARRGTELGPGSLLLACGSVGPRVVTGRHVHISAHVDLAPGSRIGDHVTFSPGVCVGAGATIEREVFLGARAVVGPDVRIGAGAVIGSGAVVGRDVPAGCTVVGRPMRVV